MPGADSAGIGEGESVAVAGGATASNAVLDQHVLRIVCKKPSFREHLEFQQTCVELLLLFPC